MEIIKFFKKGRIVCVYFDNGESIKIHYEVLCQVDLRLNQKISEEKKEHIQQIEELFSAKETSLRILTRRIHSEKEVIQKLKKKDISPKIITEVINFLNDRKYLNDELFAERFVEERFFRKKYGFSRIKNELKLKGINEQIIKSVISQYKDEDEEIAIALEKAEKKLKYYQKMKKYDEYQVKQKITAFLINRGFSFDVARKVNSRLIFKDN